MYELNQQKNLNLILDLQMGSQIALFDSNMQKSIGNPRYLFHRLKLVEILYTNNY